jgi:SAM-dependent methyltransferase
MDTRAFNDQAYAARGFAAQRFYPNEELLRFLGGHYFGLPPAARANVRVLELGCGSGSNLWMLAREGFRAHGIDISAEGLSLCRRMLDRWGVEAQLAEGDMSRLPYGDASFDLVLDVFSTYCLDEADFARCLDHVARVLAPGGRFFTYTPAKSSDAFRDRGDAVLIDGSTLDQISRPTAPFSPSPHPFRFTTVEELEVLLAARGLAVRGAEIIGRTYRRGAERFEFVSLHAEKA